MATAWGFYHAIIPFMWDALIDGSLDLTLTTNVSRVVALRAKSDQLCHQSDRNRNTTATTMALFPLGPLPNLAPKWPSLRWESEWAAIGIIMFMFLEVFWTHVKWTSDSSLEACLRPTLNLLNKDGIVILLQLAVVLVTDGIPGTRLLYQVFEFL